MDLVALLWLVVAIIPLSEPFPTDDDDAVNNADVSHIINFLQSLIPALTIFVDCKQYHNIGAHQLATWILSQLKRNDFISPSEISTIPYRIPLVNAKRNSELTSSIMGIPRTMIDNGKK